MHWLAARTSQARLGAGCAGQAAYVFPVPAVSVCSHLAAARRTPHRPHPAGTQWEWDDGRRGASTIRAVPAYRRPAYGYRTLQAVSAARGRPHTVRARCSGLGALGSRKRVCMACRARTPGRAGLAQACALAMRCLQAICLIRNGIGFAPCTLRWLTAHYSIRLARYGARRQRALADTHHGITPTGMLPAPLAPTILPLSRRTEHAGTPGRARCTHVRDSQSYRSPQVSAAREMEGVGRACPCPSPGLGEDSRCRSGAGAGRWSHARWRPGHNGRRARRIPACDSCRLCGTWDNLAPTSSLQDARCVQQDCAQAPARRRPHARTPHEGRHLAIAVVSDHADTLARRSLAWLQPGQAASKSVALAHRTVGPYASSLARALSAHYPRIRRGQRRLTGSVERWNTEARPAAAHYGSRTARTARHSARLNLQNPELLAVGTIERLDAPSATRPHPRQ